MKKQMQEYAQVHKNTPLNFTRVFFKGETHIDFWRGDCAIDPNVGQALHQQFLNSNSSYYRLQYTDLWMHQDNFKHNSMYNAFFDEELQRLFTAQEVWDNNILN